MNFTAETPEEFFSNPAVMDMFRGSFFALIKNDLSPTHFQVGTISPQNLDPNCVPSFLAQFCITMKEFLSSHPGLEPSESLTAFLDLLDSIRDQVVGNPNYGFRPMPHVSETRN